VQWIEDYVERETAVVGKCVEQAEAAIEQEQKDMKNFGNTVLKTRQPEKTFEQMLNAIGDSRSDPACSDNEEDVEVEEDDEEDTELGMLTKDDQPGWVRGRFSKTVQHRREMIRQKQMTVHQLTQLRWDDVANHLCGGETR